MRFAALAGALALAACAAPPFPAAGQLPPPAYGLPLSELPGWREENHMAALEAVRAACQVKPSAVCSELRRSAIPDGETARRFLETRFVAQPVANTPEGPGLLTGYFSPEYPARTAPDHVYSGALRPPPPTAVISGPPDPTLPSPTRAAIEAAGGPALAWLKPEDLFFLQIQGSGTLVFPDGSRRRAVYAGNNGHTFVGVARVMRERGLLADNQTSGEAIRAWLAEHRGPEAQAVMNENPRYIYFALQADDGREPAGAAGVPLPPGRAVAVDPSQHAYGDVLWISAQAPALAGAFPAYRRAVAALDTGSAIRGPVRADLYLGRGAAAGAEAGRIRHELRMFRLVPRG